MDSTGVMPEPAAMAPYRLRWPACRAVEKLPVGVMMSSDVAGPESFGT